jgi:hypothetical protein
LAASLAHQKILQDEFAVASGKRRTTNSARYFAITGGLWSGFRSNDLIKGVAVRAFEKLYFRESGHHARPQVTSNYRVLASAPTSIPANATYDPTAANESAEAARPIGAHITPV